MFLDSIYFGDFEAFLSENDLLEHFGITSTLGRFMSDSPRSAKAVTIFVDSAKTNHVVLQTCIPKYNFTILGVFFVIPKIFSPRELFQRICYYWESFFHPGATFVNFTEYCISENSRKSGKEQASIHKID